MEKDEGVYGEIYRKVANEVLKGKEVGLMINLTSILILMHSQFSAMSAAFLMLKSRSGALLALLNSIMMGFYDPILAILQFVFSIAVIISLTMFRSNEMEEFMNKNKHL